MRVSGVVGAQRRRRRCVRGVARMRGSDGAVVCEWCRRGERDGSVREN